MSHEISKLPLIWIPSKKETTYHEAQEQDRELRLGKTFQLFPWDPTHRILLGPEILLLDPCWTPERTFLWSQWHARNKGFAVFCPHETSVSLDQGALPSGRRRRRVGAPAQRRAVRVQIHTWRKRGPGDTATQLLLPFNSRSQLWVLYRIRSNPSGIKHMSCRWSSARRLCLHGSCAQFLHGFNNGCH